MNSFFDRAKNIAVDLASRSKAAAQLTVRQATRTKIASLDLPRAFAALGKHLYATGTNRDEFASLYQRIDKLNGDIEAIEAASVARVYCSDAYVRCASDALQLHGGIGFTWEHHAHLYFKRARSSATLLGSPVQHRESIAQLIGLDS